MDRKDIYLKAEELVSAMTNVNVQSNGLKDKAEIEKVKEENAKAVEKMLLEHGIEPEKQLKVAEEIKDEAPKKNFVQKIWGKIKSAFSVIKKASKVIWDFLLFFFKNKLVIISLIYVLFYSLWENIIEKTMVDMIFSHFEHNIVCDIVILLLSIGCIINLFTSKPKRYNLLENIIAGCIPLFFWAYYRILSDRFEFFSFTMIDALKYFDIVVVFSFCNIVRCFKKLKEPNFVFENGFAVDTPIEKYGDDLLNRNTFVHNYVEKILKTNTTNGAFSFGIVSPWGAGKTSFMKLMKQNIEENHKDECIIIDFNPWLYSHNSNIITLFFDELSKNLKQFKKLASEFIDYSKALSLIDTPETKIAKAFVDIIKPPSKLDDKIGAISDSIKHINKKIVVFVDDIDRLDSAEIMDVLKLIRNVSSKFPYMYFIVAYDKDYILECLKEKMHSKELDYTEKIFQSEFILPQIEKSKIKDEIYKLIPPIEEDEKEDLKNLISGNNSIIEDNITTIRDVKRICNSFTVSYSKLKGEIKVSDLFVLEILKNKYPTIYSILETERKYVLISQNNGYLLFDENNKNYNPSNYMFGDIIYRDRYNLKRYIKEEASNLHLKDSNINKIDNILDSLFPSYSFNAYEKRINNIFYTDRYFSVSLLDADISNVLFDATMNDNNIDHIKSAFQKWSTNKSNSLASKLKQYIPNTKEEQKKYIKLLLYSTSIIPFDVYYITYQIDKLKEFNDNSSFSDEDKKFIKDALCENGYSEGLALYLYSIVYNGEPFDFPLSIDELNEVRLDIFKQCINLLADDSRLIFNGYQYTKEVFVRDGKQTASPIPANKELMKKYIQSPSHFQDFIGFTIIMDHPGKYHLNKYLPLQFWDSWDEFVKYIKNVKDKTPEITEYMDFMEKCKDKDIEPINYTFKYINL